MWRGIGYGDFGGTNSIERVSCAIYMLLGQMLVAKIFAEMAFRPIFSPKTSPKHEETAKAVGNQRKSRRNRTKSTEMGFRRPQTWLTSLRNISTSQRLSERKHTQDNLVQARLTRLSKINSINE